MNSRFLVFKLFHATHFNYSACMPMGCILFVFGNVESWATAHQFMGDTAGCMGRDQLHIVQTLLLKTLILT